MQEDSKIAQGRDGGIGRRTGLKIPRRQLHGGSIPPPGTNSSFQLVSYRIKSFVITIIL